MIEIMGREEIIERAVINLTVENTELKININKVKEDKDYWFETYLKAKKAQDEAKKAHEDEINSLINKAEEKRYLSESEDDPFDPADNE